MNPHLKFPDAGAAKRFYRLLLKVYPSGFRRRYEEEMMLFFEEEWRRAGAESPGARWRCALHLGCDVFRAAPKEWAETIPRVAVMTVLAAALGVLYLFIEPIPLLLRVLGCAWLVATFGVFVIAVSGRARRTQFLLAAVGIPIGLVLSPFLGLDPKAVPPPEGALERVGDPALTGPAIYQRMGEAYRSVQTYQDTGEIRSVYSGVINHTDIKTFSTAFVRGGGFLFEFKQQFDRLDPWNEYAIWRDGSAIKHWWTLEPQVVVDSSLAYALGVAAGGSLTASTQVPGWLQPESKVAPSAHFFTNIELLGHQRVDGRDAFKLQLTRKDWPPTMVWIDANSHLIDRIFSSLSLFGGDRVDHTIILNSAVEGAF